MNINRKFLARGLAAIAIVLFVNIAVHAETRYVTQTVDGREWRLCLDDVALTTSVGTNLSSTTWESTPNNTYATSSALTDKSKKEPLEIPSTFTVDDQTYRVTAIGNRAFIRAYMTSVIIPEDVVDVWYCAFYQCYNLTNVWFKGHDTLSSEFGRNYVSLNFRATSVFSATTAIKNVLVGPNIKRANSNFQVPGGTGVLVLLPYRADNTTWAGCNVAGTTPNVVYYNDIDSDFNTIVFSPTNSADLATLFADLPALAPQIKTAFGLDVKIVVSTPIETATAIPAAFIASEIPLETTEWVAFEAKTQDALDAVLGYLPEDSKVLIDPSGATEGLTVPSGRNVAMLMASESTIEPEIRGLMFIVR